MTDTRTPLTQEAIVAAAVALADADGSRALTMRKLAHSIGFEVMSLYNHVANKGELIGLMVDAIAGEVEHQGDEPDDPLGAVRATAMSLRAVLVRHPWAPELWLSNVPGPHRTRVMEDLLRFLHLSDLTPAMAHHGFHAVINHVLGYTMQELGMAAVTDVEDMAEIYLRSLPTETFPFTIAHVQQHIDGDSGSSFELVLDLIIDGIVGLSAAEQG